MTHTVDSLMAQADAYAYQKALINVSNMLHSQILETDEARDELHAALTEALQAAQPVAHPDYTLLRQALEALLPHKSNALRWYTPVDAAIDALRARLESV